MWYFECVNFEAGIFCQVRIGHPVKHLIFIKISLLLMDKLMNDCTSSIHDDDDAVGAAALEPGLQAAPREK